GDGAPRRGTLPRTPRPPRLARGGWRRRRWQRARPGKRLARSGRLAVRRGRVRLLGIRQQPDRPHRRNEPEPHHVLEGLGEPLTAPYLLAAGMFVSSVVLLLRDRHERLAHVHT